MDSYQAVYDATRSRISGCDAGSTIEDVLRNAGFDRAADNIAEAFRSAAYEYERPSTVYRPKLFQDGDQWCVLYGDNLQDGVSGFGASPHEAMYSFDKAWRERITTHAFSLARGEGAGK